MAAGDSFQCVRLGIVGCGMITSESHLPAILKSPMVEPAFLVDNDLERANSLVRKFGITTRTSTNLAQVLDQADGVIVATPNHTHVSIASEALQRGIPVLIEKPLANTTAEARQLCELAESRGTFISVGYNLRHFPCVPLFKRLLRENFFGTLRHFHFEFGTVGGWAPVSGYNLDRRQAGGGVLVVSGTHVIDRMLDWFGEPSHITYADDSRGGVEANCKASMEFDNELGRFTGSFFFSKTIALKNKFFLQADGYNAELPLGEQRQITLLPKNLPGTKMFIQANNAPELIDSYKSQVEEFAQCIRLRQQPVVNGREGLLSVEFFERCYADRRQLEEPWAWYTREQVLA
jgi:predicted dehydrogenase